MTSATFANDGNANGQHMFGNPDFDTMFRKHLSADRIKKLKDFYNYASPRVVNATKFTLSLIVDFAAFIFKAIAWLLKFIFGNANKNKGSPPVAAVGAENGKASEDGKAGKAATTPGNSLLTINSIDKVTAPGTQNAEKIWSKDAQDVAFTENGAENLYKSLPMHLLEASKNIAEDSEKCLVLAYANALMDEKTKESIDQNLEKGNVEKAGQAVAEKATTEILALLNSVRNHLEEGIRTVLNGVSTSDLSHSALVSALVSGLPTMLSSELVHDEAEVEAINNFLLKNIESVHQFMLLRASAGASSRVLDGVFEPMETDDKRSPSMNFEFPFSGRPQDNGNDTKTNGTHRPRG